MRHSRIVDIRQGSKQPCKSLYARKEFVIGGVTHPARNDRGSPLPQAFDGIRILDFTQVVAGPYAAQLLGNQGAEGHQGRAGPGRPVAQDLQDEHPAGGRRFGGLRAGQPGQALDGDRSEEPGRPRRDPEDRRRLRRAAGEFPARRHGPAGPGLRCGARSPAGYRLLFDFRLRPDRAAGRRARL